MDSVAIACVLAIIAAAAWWIKGRIAKRRQRLHDYYETDNPRDGG